MTSAEKIKLADQSIREMVKKVGDEYENKTLPHPANKDDIKAFKKQWGEEFNERFELINERLRLGFYENNAAAFKKDYDDAYYARFIFRINEDEWEYFLNK